MFTNNNGTYELSIQMSSIQLSQTIVSKHETVRVSITTLPERQKQAIHVKAKELRNFNHTFKVNITEETEKIIVVFRKKDFFGSENIIASTVIRSEEFKGMVNQQMPMISGINNINIYEPAHQQNEKKQTRKNDEYLYEYIGNHVNQGTRKVLGQIRAQFILTQQTSYCTNYNNKLNNYNYQYNQNFNQQQFDNQFRNTTLEIY